MSSDIQNTVKTRRVFYIPGYDPIHPRRYRELYRTEGAAQPAISDYQLTLSPKQGGGNYGWQVDSVIDGGAVHVDAEVLVWSDIVRDSMANSIAATYWQLVRTAWIYITTGALWRLMKLRKGPVIAALYPVGSAASGMSGILCSGPADWQRRAIVGNGDLRASDFLAALVDADNHSEPYRWQYCVLGRVALV